MRALSFDLERQGSTTEDEHEGQVREAKWCLGIYVVIGIGLTVLALTKFGTN
jgi:hypothetical protein